MKQKFHILAFSALAMLESGSAFAGDWIIPTPAFRAMNPVESSATTADTVYVWNVGQQGFLAAGEAWSTQAVVANTTSEKWVVIATAEDGVYKLKNVNRTNKYLFRTYSDEKVGVGNKGCFVDGSDSNDTWAIANLGNNLYSIQMPETAGDVDETSNPFDAAKFLGTQTSHASAWATSNNGGVTKGVYFDVPYEGNEAGCQFAFVNKADYEVWAAKNTLKDLLEEGERRGLDVTSEGALLNNASATLAEVEAAVEALNSKISAVVTPDNPQDLTYKIQNADLESGSLTGWVSTTAAQNKSIATNVSEDAAANDEGAFKNKFYENWKSSPISGKMYQKVAKLPEGIYKVGLSAYVNTFDPSNAKNQKQYVYVNDTKKLLTRGNPRAYEMFISLADTDTLEIGLAQDSLIANWMGLDNAKLYFLGKGIESYRYLNKNVLADIEKAIENPDDVQDFAYTESVYTAAKTIAQEGIDTSDKEASYAAYLKAQKGLADLQQNVVLYAQLYKDAQNAEEEYYNNYSDQEALMDASEEGMNMFDAAQASNEELSAMIQKIAEALRQAKLNSYQVGDDVTNLIDNPTFNDETAEANYQQPQSTEGWIGGSVIGAGGTTDTRLAEVFDKDCDIHQDLSGLKKGAYRLSIQAFYRPGAPSADAYQAYLNGDSITQAYIYMGQTQQRVKSIYAYTFPETITTMSRYNSWSNVGGDNALYVPNSMDEAYTAFNGSTDGEQDPAYENNYRNIVYGVVTENGGSMPIGFKVQNHATSSWVIFRDFRLEYLGNDPVYIKPVLTNKIDEAKTDFLGKKMYADDKNALNQAVAAGEAALATNNGDDMMTAFTAIANAETQAQTSIDAYAKLALSYDSLAAQYEASDKASQEARKTAEKLMAEVKSMLDNGTIAATDVPAKQEEMKAARKALMILAGSDDEPSKYTNWIKNPTYASQDGWVVNKISGAGTPGVQYNTMEIWNATADIHQDIEGLPEGVYEVRVQSMFRPVSSDEAWKDFLGDSIENYGQRATVYANWDSITPSYWCMKYDPDKYSWMTGSYSDMVDATLDENGDTLQAVTYHFANNRQAVEYQFQMNTYPVQTFYTYVGSDGLLRLGFKNTAHKVQDWFVVSNWELYYHGKDSKYAESTGINDIEKNENVTYNEIYTIDGRRVNELQKGLNIVRGKTASGKIVTKKIVVK